MIDSHLQLAVFRLNDMCVGVQEGMDRFLNTAFLEKMPGAEAVFSWLAKRAVRICLLSDYGRSDTEIILRRLGWTVDEGGTVQQVITRQQDRENPVLLAQQIAGITHPRLSFSALDTPRLLQLANQARVHFNLAVCNGRSSYNELAVAPHHAMLDSLLQLPNFVLQHLPQPELRAGTQERRNIPRLHLPRPLSRG
ncbi:phosphoglycolate phosphatase-like HAD superfamily hydrolase [Lewinella aquimaris]|uniref:Phosphoglycolate phosphatase-like HAD superfamily hydrolase n=1 Tax=Neolewinella aquimaris TaxID=1835722 RepID=A0A840E6N6_9BACT|nr:hypothetical protein [Neolewinella aquimaris]MBB4079392.1 phosphoglycolate phosphatase-like HAD superfamily hydrolase [Neolewinella aquimaris]